MAAHQRLQRFPVSNEKKYAIGLCGKYFERMSAVLGQVLTSALVLAQVLPVRIFF